MKKTIIITENQFNKIFEMAYPTTFNMDEFKQLRSFSKRFNYCKERLEYISSGSGRYVFGIDQEKVLKLAKNQKGIAQNENEYDIARYESIIAQVFDCDDDFLWIEMERVNKITVSEFKQLTGMDFNFFKDNIEYEDMVSINSHKYRNCRMTKPIRNDDELWENEFFCQITNLIGGYGMEVGDLERINSYGKNSKGEIKLVDAGLSEDVWNTHYLKIR
jgi:hypothetical protein